MKDSNRIDNLFNEVVNLKMNEAKGTHLTPATIEMFKNRLIEIIAQDAILLIQLKMPRNGVNSPENLQSKKHIKDICEHFGVQLPTKMPEWVDAMYK